jgi:hypothetical protein
MQACKWVERCSVPGCAGTCILNADKLENYLVLLDREMNENSFQLCPSLALTFNAVRESVDSGELRKSRKLLNVRTHALAWPAKNVFSCKDPTH